MKDFMLPDKATETTLFGIEIGAVRRMLADYQKSGIDPNEVVKLRKKVYDLEHELGWLKTEKPSECRIRVVTNLTDGYEMARYCANRTKHDCPYQDFPDPAPSDNPNKDGRPVTLPKFSTPTCRGSFDIGSACGHCEKCLWLRGR